MDDKPKILFITLLITTLVVGACGQNMRQPTGDWETYKNEVNGYSFNYPADCTFGGMPRNCKENPPEERPPECLCFLDNKNPDRVFLQAFIGDVENLSLAVFAVSHPDSPVYNPPPGAELIPWLKEGFSELHKEIPDEPNMELDGIEAVRISTPQSEMAPSYDDIYFFLNGKMFNINLLEPDNKEIAVLYNQMLSTFRIDR
jgi:hypothetical protein